MQNQYRDSFDILRVVAIFGIVWAHMFAPLAQLGRTALDLFLMLTAALAIRSIRRSSGSHTWVLRGLAVLALWVGWSLFYKLIEVYRTRDIWTLFEINEPNSLLIGSTIHLWYLPFILLAAPICLLATRLIRSRRDLIIACAIAVVPSVGLIYVHVFNDLPEPFAQWTFALPAYFYGIFAAYGWEFRMTAVPLSFMAVTSALALLLTGSDAAPQYLLAAVIFEACWMMPWGTQQFRPLGQMVLGIYLIHPFFMLVVFKLFGGNVNRALGAIATFAMSMAAVYVLQRIPMVRKIVELSRSKTDCAPTSCPAYSGAASRHQPIDKSTRKTSRRENLPDNGVGQDHIAGLAKPH
ncbi:acyltransferase [Leptospira interrogans]